MTCTVTDDAAVAAVTADGASATFGGDATHLPVTAHSPAVDGPSAGNPGGSESGSEPDSSGGAGSSAATLPAPSGAATASNGEQATPEMAQAAAVLSRGDDGGGLFNLVALIGLVMVVIGVAMRRRIAR